MNQLTNCQEQDEYYLLSAQGLIEFHQNYDNNNKSKNLVWTTDNRIELPIRMKRNGPGSEAPITIIDMIERSKNQYGQKVAQKYLQNKQWICKTYNQFYTDIINFAKACVYLNIKQDKAVNIIGQNCPEWHTAFFGSIFASLLPVGVYSTNHPASCLYIAEHSNCEMVVLYNIEQLNKYLKIQEQLPNLKLLVLIQGSPPINLPISIKDKIILWNDFLKLGQQQFNDDEELNKRKRRQTPGRCSTLVYTSGTTGPPKGVMLSHDNYTWTANACADFFQLNQNKNRQFKVVSYLPLSHVASQIADISTFNIGGCLYYADINSMELIQILKQVKPTWFLGTPRVWEKIQEKLIIMENTRFYGNILKWAKQYGNQGIYNEKNNLQNNVNYWLVKKFIFKIVTQQLGLDEAPFLAVGAAPIKPDTMKYFLDFGLYIYNMYGMSETSGPQTITSPDQFKKYDKLFFKSAGQSLKGLDLKIKQPDQKGIGEICFKGRNRFMGYFKDEKSTIEALDSDGYLKSGDQGKIVDGNLTITGRIKELIITAGGENVAPILIENQLKQFMGNLISNALVVGDQQKYLVILITFNNKLDQDGAVLDELTEQNIYQIAKLGSKAKTIEEIKNCRTIKKFIDQSIEKVNRKAISRAHHIKKWAILDKDFSIDGGELTPTLKLKRKFTVKKYKAIIELLYQDPSL